MKKLILLFTLFVPLSAVAECDWSKPQPQSDCYPANPSPSVTSGDVGGVPNSGTPSPAPVAVPKRPPTLSQLYNQCEADRQQHIDAINSCVAVLDQFNSALKACVKKKRR